MDKSAEKKFSLLKNIIYCLKISWDTSRLYTVCRIAVHIITALLPLASIAVISAVLNILVSGRADVIPLFLGMIAAYLVIEVAYQSLGKVSEYLQQIHEGMIEKYLNVYVAEKSADVDLRYFDFPEYYDRLRLMKSNSAAINQIVWNIVELIGNIVTFATAFVIIFQYSPLFSSLIIITIIPLAIYDQNYSKKLYDWQVHNVGDERKMDYISGLITERSQAKNIRVFSIADHLIHLYSSIWKSWFSKRKALVKKWSVVSLLLSIIPQAVTVLFLIEIGMNIIRGTSVIGDFSLYSGMIGQIVVSIFLITTSIMRLTENKLRVDDFRNFSEWENKVEGTGELELNTIEHIEFDHVFFTYPGNSIPTIKDLSVSFDATERLALVGGNGSGKTTLVKLLLRFYDACDGQILINGVNISKFTPESIRRCYSIMFQDFSNYAFTLRENILISDINKQYSEEELLEICKISGVDQVMTDWKNGLDTYLSREFVTDGIELSGGENQKIALARTFFRDGQFIILDEPSSSIDPESEHWLFEKMIELCRNKGVLLITHRLSNVVLADRILVIENGELLEDGTHEELMRQNGRYATLFRYQAENYVNGAKRQ